MRSCTSVHKKFVYGGCTRILKSTVALPPTIPTSFVPKQPVTTHVRNQKSGQSVFFFIAAVVAGISALVAAGVFGYELYLKNARDTKFAELTQAQQAVDLDVVEEFIRLRNRLTEVDRMLDTHIQLSMFFKTLEEKTLQTVRFNSLSLSVAEDRSAEVTMEGVARSFNALAAQSSAIASEKRIKRAIFSDIAVNTNGTVSFSLTATLDPRLITSAEAFPGIPAASAEVNDLAVPTVPVATTTGTSTGATTSPQ